LPLEREQFKRDLASPGRFDFAARIQARYGLTAEGAWRLFERSATYAAQVCDAVEKLGVSIFRAGDLGELRSSFTLAKVVSLVSHTRLLPLDPADVDGPQELCQMILGDDSPISTGLQKALRRSLGDPPWSDSYFLEGLSRVTELALQALAEDRPGDRGSTPSSEDFLPPEHLHRLALECLYGDHVRASEVVELRDGLHPLRAIIEAIPAGWRGVLDLTLCNSAALAPWIKRSRPDCLLVVNRRAASLDVRLARYHVTMKGLRCQPRPFVEMLAEVHSALLEEGRL
jgi:hypothetical protein